MKDFFLELGFKDITEKYPIHLDSSLSDTFGNLHLYQKRYTLEGIGFKLEVLWGESWYSTYFGVILTGMNYKCSLYDDTHVMDAKDYFKKLLHQMIEVYCSKIKESFIRGGIIKYERTDLSILV